MNRRAEHFLLTTTILVTMVVGGCNKTPLPTADGPVTSTAVGNVSDVDITEHVKTALHQNDMLKGFDINVVTVKGDVRLTGVLDTQAQADEAIKIARASEGAHAVHNELTLKK